MVVEVYSPKKKRKTNGGSSAAPKWFREYAKKQDDFNKMILSRLDNLVKKNKLNE